MGSAPALDHVQIAAPAGCEPRARRFYGGLLGLTELDKPPAVRDRGGVWFSLSGAQLHVGVAEPFVPAVKAHPALRFEDGQALEALAQRLEAAGCDIQWDGGIAGVSRFFTSDPWGNRLELLAVRPS